VVFAESCSVKLRALAAADGSSSPVLPISLLFLVDVFGGDCCVFVFLAPCYACTFVSFK
jgi:hypothetical protein